MRSHVSILVVATQTWLQISRLAMRFVDYGCSLSVICPEESPLSHAPWVSKRFRYSLTDSISAIRRAIAASGADYLLPTDDLAVWFLHEMADQSPELRPLVERSLGSRTHYSILRSRLRLLELARELGIVVPRTEKVSSYDQLEHWCAERTIPCVLKKDGTWGGNGVQVLQAPAQAPEAWTLLAAEKDRRERLLQWLRNGDPSAFTRLQCLREPEITVQAFVHGTPANAMYACHQGRVLGEVQARVIASKGRRGPSLLIELIDDRRISRAGALLANALGLSGFFGLDFMLDEQTGEPMLIELNPRSTRLGHLAVAGQPDLAGLLWAQWTGSDVPACGDAGLGRTVCFYPEGEELTRKAAGRPSFRTDVLAHETGRLVSLTSSRPAHTSIRGQLWRSLARVKGLLHKEPEWQAFYYGDFAGQDYSLKFPESCGGKHDSAVAIAS